VVGLAILTLAVVGGAGIAFAHDPIILTDSQTSPDAGPLLPDGTISFAVYGTLNSAGDTRGLRVRFGAGDSLDITMLIPDRSPENELPDSAFPTLRIDAPDGTSRTLTPTERVAFEEPISHTSYVRYLELDEPAQAGEYRLTVSGSAPARFTLAVGTTERFGTPVENVTNREDASAEVQHWYATPPATPAAAPSATAPSINVASTIVSSTIVASTTVSSTGSSSTTARATDTSVAGSQSAQATSAPTPGRGIGFNALAIVVGALVVLTAGWAWRLRRRDNDVRPPTNGVATPD